MVILFLTPSTAIKRQCCPSLGTYVVFSWRSFLHICSSIKASSGGKESTGGCEKKVDFPLENRYFRKQKESIKSNARISEYRLPKTPAFTKSRNHIFDSHFKKLCRIIYILFRKRFFIKIRAMRNRKKISEMSKGSTIRVLMKKYFDNIYKIRCIFFSGFRISILFFMEIGF